jgi:hypothetical protein
MVTAGCSAGILPAPENAARMAASGRWGYHHILPESVGLLTHILGPASFLRDLCALRGDFFLELRPAAALHYPLTAPVNRARFCGNTSVRIRAAEQFRWRHDDFPDLPTNILR